MIALLCALLFAALTAQAQAPVPAAEAEAAAPDAAEAARILADALQDPAARAALIAQLRAAAAGNAAVPAAEPDESFDAALTRAVADRTRAFAQGLSDETVAFIDAVSDWDALSEQAAGIDWRRVGDDAVAIGIVMAVTGGLFYVLRKATYPLRTRFARDDGQRPIMGKLARIAAIFASDLTLILLAWGAGYAVALWGVGASAQMDLRQSLFLNAFLVIEVGRLVLRMILCARRPTLRLIPIGDAAAKEIYVRVARILSVLGYGMLLAVPVVRGAFGAKPAEWLALGVVLVAAAMAIRLIRRNRLAVRAAIEAYATRRGADGVIGGALTVLGQAWHLLAIAYVFGLFVVWTARPADSLGFMLSATLQSAAAIVLGTMAMVAISRRIAGGVRLNQDYNRRLPMLETRLNALVPNALSFLRLLLIVAVIGVILEVWGVFAVSAWLATDAGSRVVQGLISASFILVACGVVWIAVASWIEYKVTPHEGYIVRAREQTLLTLLRNAFTVVMVVMAAMLTLSAIGINIAPLLAGAGVIGLAIGFGAQRLVQDIITGVFIQFENAMNTGDVVAVGAVSGVVEKLTIRSVGIRDLSGTFHLVPFSSVDTVANLTKDFSYHVAEIGIGYTDDIGVAKAAMLDAFEEVRAGEHGPKIIGDFDMHGVIALAESAVTLRGRIRTLAGGQWAVGRAYTEIVKRRLDEAGIEIPFRNVTLHMQSTKPDAPGPALLRPGSDPDEPPSPSFAG